MKPPTVAQKLKARGGHATAPLRPLKKIDEQVRLAPGPALTRAEKEKRRKEAMD